MVKYKFYGVAPVFEIDEPRLDRCGVCEHHLEGKDVGAFEARPTGRDLKIQTWAYCRSCWQHKKKDLPLSFRYEVPSTLTDMLVMVM